MKSFALHTSAELNERLAHILGVLQEKDEIYPACVYDLAAEARCLLSIVVNRSSLNVDLDAVLAEIEVNFVDDAPTTEH